MSRRKDGGRYSIPVRHLFVGIKQIRPVLGGPKRAGRQAAERYCHSDTEVIDPGDSQPARTRPVPAWL